MKIKWCWRCQVKIPMLNEEEYEIASKLYSGAFKKRVGKNRELRYKELLDYYEKTTHFKEN